MEEQIIKILRDSIALSTNRNTIYTDTAAEEIASHFKEFILWVWDFDGADPDKIEDLYNDWIDLKK